MGNVAEGSANSMANNGAADGVPNDGTGMTWPASTFQGLNVGRALLTVPLPDFRSREARPMARALPRVAEAAICCCPGVDQDNSGH